MTPESNKNIDQILKERLADFGSIPSNDLWNKIDANLSKNTRRKKSLWISVFTGLLLSGAGITYLYWPVDNYETVTHHREVAPLIKVIKKGENKKQESSIDAIIEDNNTAPDKELDPLVKRPAVELESGSIEKSKVESKTNNTVDQEESPIKDNLEQTTKPKITVIDAMRPNSSGAASKKHISSVNNVLDINDTLTLSIEFSNLERKLADKITIEQSVPDFLDINSIAPIESSHDYKYKVKKSSRKIIWTLKNIPANGLKGSKGYIDYDVVVIKKAKESQLKSKEVITFDYGYFRTKTTN